MTFERWRHMLIPTSDGKRATFTVSRTAPTSIPVSSPPVRETPGPMPTDTTGMTMGWTGASTARPTSARASEGVQSTGRGRLVRVTRTSVDDTRSAPRAGSGGIGRSPVRRGPVRRSWCGWGLALATVVLAAACSNSGPRATPSDTSSISTGFRGGVRTGVGLSLAGVRARGRGQITLNNSGPLDGKMTLVVVPLEPTCDRFPSNLPCPKPEEMTLVFRASGLLDFRTPIDIGDAGVATVRHSGPDESTTVLPVRLPKLEEGRHCVLVALLEDEATVVEGQFPDHGNVALFIVHNHGDQPDHCNPPHGELPGTRFIPEGRSMGRCGPPNLTTADPDATGTPSGVLVTISLCGPGQITVFTRDGRLQGEGSTHPPFLTDGYPDQVVGFVGTLPRLPAGWWRVISASVGTTEPGSVLYSRPILSEGGSPQPDERRDPASPVPGGPGSHGWPSAGGPFLPREAGH